MPDPPATQSINPADGPKARQRLKLLRRLFGEAASSVPSNCHFVLLTSEENPSQPYKARFLGLTCVTGGKWGNGTSTLTWADGAGAITTED